VDSRCGGDAAATKDKRAKQMLSTSRLAVNEIALRCGFAGSTRFCEVFKRVTGMTPTEYREQQRLV